MLIDLINPRRSINYEFSIDHVNATGDRWFRITSGVPSNVAGYQVPHDSIITALSFMNQRSASGNILIYNDTTLIYTLTLGSQTSKIETGLSVSLSQGDILKAAIGSGIYDYPVLSIEINWNQ